MNLAGFGDVVLPFLILLGVLVFFHELGHFLVAKWCGVKVEKFSLGFGPALLHRKVGETDYVIAALPLGGFVKMLGEVPGEELPEAERDRAVNYKPYWQRIAIALAGPAMNFVLPVFILAAMLMGGVPTLVARVGVVVPDSAAERAGVLPGDRVVEVAGTELWQWRELVDELARVEAAAVPVVVERDGARVELAITRERGEDGSLGPLGIEPSAPAAVVAVVDPHGAGAAAGLETGDRVTQLGGEPIDNRYALEAALASASAPLELRVVRPVPGGEQEIVTHLKGVTGTLTLEALGLGSVDFAITRVDPATPARRAGLLPGDIFLRLAGERVVNWEMLAERIRASGGDKLAVVVLRDGERVELEVDPVEMPIPVDGELETRWAIGIAGGALRAGGEVRELVVRNPLTALWRGAEGTGQMVTGILYGLSQLVTGKLGTGGISGPIGIGEIAADAFKDSWTRFLEFMAIISVNLAILNLLPVPILDGGMIIMTLAEAVRGGPLSLRAREVAQTVGLSFILMLMGLAFWNDIARNWERFVGFFMGLV